MTAVLRCRGVSVDRGKARTVQDVDLELSSGESLALLGPSGSGKTTLMYAIAGFLDVATGEIEIEGTSISTPVHTVPPERRPVGLVFQNYALWPHLDATETVAYPMRRSGTSRRNAATEAGRLLDLVGIGDLGHRKPAELSGGQQQRVGLARALARDASVYLFDEPTAHLDASAKVSIQQEILSRRRETGAAAIYSTHDSAEALAIANRVAIIRSGTIVQVGAPREVYERPVDLWSARLTGPASILELDASGDGTGQVDIDLDGCRVRAQSSGPLGSKERVEVIVRPEWVRLGGPIGGRVEEVWFRGPHTDYLLHTRVGVLEVRVAGAPALSPGDSTGLEIVRAWVPAQG